MGRDDETPGSSPATAGAQLENASDRALVRRLLDGDEKAFAGVVDQYHGRLVRLALSFVKDHATAEEVVQDTWLGVLRGLRTFEGRSVRACAWPKDMGALHECKLGCKKSPAEKYALEARFSGVRLGGPLAPGQCVLGGHPRSARFIADRCLGMRRKTCE